MKKKKVLALVLAVATLLGGCGKAPAETAGNTAAEKESGAASTTAAESTGSEAAAGEEGGGAHGAGVYGGSVHRR